MSNQQHKLCRSRTVAVKVVDRLFTVKTADYYQFIATFDSVESQL